MPNKRLTKYKLSTKYRFTLDDAILRMTTAVSDIPKLPKWSFLTSEFAHCSTLLPEDK